MIDDIISELNDIQTLATVAVADDNSNTSQAVLRVIEQKIPQVIEILEELDNGRYNIHPAQGGGHYHEEIEYRDRRPTL